MIKRNTSNKQGIVIKSARIFLSMVFFIFFSTRVSSQINIKKEHSDWSHTEVLKQKQVNEKTEVRIFPNPIKNNQVHIQLSKTILINAIKIYDILGKKVFTKKLESLENKISFRPNLSPGIYIIRVDIADKGSISKKMIIQ